MSKLTTREYDYLFKLLIIGDSGVGKSSILLRFSENTYTGTFITTIGVDFKVKTIQVGDKRLKLQIWDTAGQERFRTITTTYYRGTHGVIVVYDVNIKNTFDNIKKWLDEIKRNCDEVPVLLVGNKDDEPDLKQVTTNDGHQFAESRNVDFVETSAKENKNIDSCFNILAKKVLEKKEASLGKETLTSDKLDLNQGYTHGPKKLKCCK